MTPFAALGSDLEKQANPAKLVSRGLGWLGSKLAISGRKATDKAVSNAVGKPEFLASPLQKRVAQEAAEAAARASAGKLRQGAGARLGQAGLDLANSPGAQRAINYGGGTALAGAGLYGANRLGHSSGFDKGFAGGVEQGVDAGTTMGLETAANQMQQNQPGYLGGLMSALKGQSGGQINMGQAYGDMGNNRQMLINQLMGQ
jgi:hypothetical protein